MWKTLELKLLTFHERISTLITVWNPVPRLRRRPCWYRLWKRCTRKQVLLCRSFGKRSNFWPSKWRQEHRSRSGRAANGESTRGPWLYPVRHVSVLLNTERASLNKKGDSVNHKLDFWSAWFCCANHIGGREHLTRSVSLRCGLGWPHTWRD